MKQKGTVILLFLVSLALLVSCSSAKKSEVLCISHSSWSGTAAGAGEKETAESYTVKKGDSIELGGMCGLTVKIVSVSGEKIVLKTNISMSDHDDGTIDLAADKTKFVLKAGELLTLMTPTMDAGDSYRFEIQSADDQAGDKGAFYDALIQRDGYKIQIHSKEEGHPSPDADFETWYEWRDTDHSLTEIAVAYNVGQERAEVNADTQTITADGKELSYVIENETTLRLFYKITEELYLQIQLQEKGCFDKETGESIAFQGRIEEILQDKEFLKSICFKVEK